MRNKIKVGFTGSQRGVTRYQYFAMETLLRELAPAEVHAGDCIGADAAFMDIVIHYSPAAKTFGHIPDNDSKRAFFRYDKMLPAKPYLERNKDIVEASDVLIATPATAKEEQRSGTWSTVRFARKNGKPIYLILPDGKVVNEAKAK